MAIYLKAMKNCQNEIIGDNIFGLQLAFKKLVFEHLNTAY